MSRQIFVSLPVKNLKASMDFFGSLGFDFNPQFTDVNAACMIVGEGSAVMLIVKKYFSTFIEGSIADTDKSREAIITITANSRDETDDMIKAAVAAGGRAAKKSEDQDWLYGRSFYDLDGHLWEILFLDISRISD